MYLMSLLDRLLGRTDSEARLLQRKRAVEDALAVESLKNKRADIEVKTIHAQARLLDAEAKRIEAMTPVLEGGSDGSAG